MGISISGDDCRRATSSVACAEAASDLNLHNLAIADFSDFCIRVAADGTFEAPRVLTTEGSALDLAGAQLLEGDRLVLAADISRKVTVLGRDFAPVNTNLSGPEDVLVFEMSSSGSLTWAVQAGDDKSQTPTSLAKSEAGLALVGTFVGSIDFGKGPLQAASGARSAFALSLQP